MIIFLTKRSDQETVQILEECERNAINEKRNSCQELDNSSEVFHCGKMVAKTMHTNQPEPPRYSEEYSKIIRKAMKAYLSPQTLQKSDPSTASNKSNPKSKVKPGNPGEILFSTKLETIGNKSHEDFEPKHSFIARNKDGRKKPEAACRKDYKVPSELDILCGRSKVAFDHPGNQNFRLMIARAIDDYSKCTTRCAKSLFIQRLIASVMKNGGYFLKYDRKERKWYDGGIDVAKIRVGTALRDASIPNKNKSIDQIRRRLSISA